MCQDQRATVESLSVKVYLWAVQITWEDGLLLSENVPQCASFSAEPIHGRKGRSSDFRKFRFWNSRRAGSNSRWSPGTPIWMFSLKIRLIFRRNSSDDRRRRVPIGEFALVSVPCGCCHISVLRVNRDTRLCSVEAWSISSVPSEPTL